MPCGIRDSRRVREVRYTPLHFIVVCDTGNGRRRAVHFSGKFNARLAGLFFVAGETSVRARFFEFREQFC